LFLEGRLFVLFGPSVLLRGTLPFTFGKAGKVMALFLVGVKAIELQSFLPKRITHDGYLFSVEHRREGPMRFKEAQSASKKRRALQRSAERFKEAQSTSKKRRKGGLTGILPFRQGYF